MRLSHILVFATTFLASTTALSPSATTPLKALRALHEGNNNGGRILRIHEPVDEDTGDNKEERGGGVNNFLNKFRYQSQGAHGADDLNPTLVQQLRNNPRLFEQMRTNDDLRKNIYSAWRGVKLHSGEVKTAMKNHGYTKEEYKQFVREYKNFKPEDLSF
ncbi:RxLR effector protein [Phytophthora megakarya]|uniref:RxLR effector protein n=1 Tax=Phytophthora megakarya TaxID=4795 RepID=A0A225VII1_9STRA|nr:RxLR effector protein [Phytophthora megakarya]